MRTNAALITPLLSTPATGGQTLDRYLQEHIFGPLGMRDTWASTLTCVRSIQSCFEHMMEAVHRYEGTVNQIMGDGIMAQ